jgi:uncharacterized repeat protein (TIGR01451 family)
MKNINRKSLRGLLRASTSRSFIVFTQVLVYATLFFINPNTPTSLAAPGTQIQLGAALTTVYDGTSPFISIDPNANNGLVATLDDTKHTFDVNINTLDGNSHSVSSITIVASLNSASSDVAWLDATVDSRCNTKTISVDGHTLTCVINTTITTGTTMNIAASWWGLSSVPNNTPVNISFNVTAVAIPDGTNSADPDPAISNTNTVNVVSNSSAAEVTKFDSASQIIRDVNGVPTTVRVFWTVMAEVKNPNFSGQVKGISTSSLGNLTMTDQVGTGASQWASIQNTGTLVDCRDWVGQVWTSDAPWSRYNNGDWGQSCSVEDSGSWSCSQPGGTGTDISINASSIKWAPQWYPSSGGYSNAYWGHGPNSANHQFDTPTGQHNVAAVASQAIVVDYPFSAVVAFDGQPGDLYLANPNYVRWCNDANNITVIGNDPSYSDNISNNRGCTTVVYGINYVSHSKTFMSKDENNIAINDLGFVPSGDYAAEDFVAPNHRFINRISTENQGSSFDPLSNVAMCDAIDTTKNTFISTNDITFSAWYWHDKTQTPWYNYRLSGTPVFGVMPTGVDIEVEFAATNATWASDQDMREYNCDNPSLVWVTDPSSHPSGLMNANLVRVRLNTPLPPGVTLTVDFAQRALPSIVAGDVLRNYMQYKDSTNPSWQYAIDQWGNRCELLQPAPSGIFQYTTTCDRLYVSQPKALLLDSDTTWAPCSNYGCLQDWAVNTSINSNWTFGLKGGVIWNTPASMTGVKVWDVLPPDLAYVSSTLEPTLAIQDCDASINPACVTTPLARTNTGYKTLMWDRGDVNFVPSNPDQGVMSEEMTLFGDWQVTTHVLGHLPSGVYLQNRSWVTVDTGATVDALPSNFATDSMETTIPSTAIFGRPSHNEYMGSFNYDWVQTVAYDEFSVTKEVVDSAIGLNGTVEYDLGYGNKAGITKTVDSIDVLPFNGDGRLPSSVIDGGYTVSVDLARAPQVSDVYVTDAPSNMLDRDPNNNPTAGTGIWMCTYAQIGNPGCPATNTITGVRFVANSVAVGEYGTIRVALTTYDNDGSEVYTNNWMARASGLALPVYSDDVEAVTPDYVKIGDYVWADINGDGVQDGSEVGIDGATVALLDSLGNSVDDPSNPGNPYEVLTGDNPATLTVETGWYQFSAILPGIYTVLVTPPPDYIQSYDFDGGLDNQAVTNPTSGQIIDTMDFGFVPPIYDLSLVTEVTSPSGFIVPGTEVTFTIRVKNQGNRPSGWYDVTDTLPAECMYVTSSDAGSDSGGVVTWTHLASLAAGATKDITVQCLVGISVADGAYRNWAEISNGRVIDDDSVPNDNTGSGMVDPDDIYTDRTLLSDVDTDLAISLDEDDNDLAVLTVYPVPRVSVDKKLYKGHDSGAQCVTNAQDEVVIVDAAQSTHDLTYCFTVVNTGTSYLDSLSLNDSLLLVDETDVVYLPSVSNSLPLAPGQSATYYYETAMNTSLDNSVTVSMTPTDSAGVPTGQTTVTAGDNAARFIYVYDPPYGVKSGNVENGNQIEWRMVWVNDSTYVANNVVITDQIPTDMDYVGSLVCQAFGATTVSSCIYEAPSVTYPNGRVAVIASLAPNPGVTPQQSASASNRLEIKFLAKPKSSTDTRFENQAQLAWDFDGDGIVDSISKTDDLKEPGVSDPSVVTVSNLANSGTKLTKPVIMSVGAITVVTLLFIVSRRSTKR